MLRKLTYPVLVAFLMLWVVGCSENPTDVEVAETLNLEGEFGGYKATSESPGFGDSELLAADSDEEDIDDPMLSSPIISALVEDTDAGLFHFRAVWGQLRYDSTITEVTDWSGSLTISRGAEVIRRLIRFEPGQDSVLERTDPKLIEWVSYTTVHHDGISVDLFVPRPVPILDSTVTTEIDPLGNTIEIVVVDSIYPDPVTVSFETGPYTRTFTLGELAALDTIVYLEDSNAVAFHAVQLFRIPCPRGFLAGVWGPDSTGQGVFRGRWISRHGYLAGYLKGHYGVNNSGNRVLFGKWINRTGQFEGFLRGTYAPHPATHAYGNAFGRAGGWFKAEIYNADKAPIGALRGKYRSADHFRGGFFQGRWKLYCGVNTPVNYAFNFNDGF
jgi:hypothetical protein